MSPFSTALALVERCADATDALADGEDALADGDDAPDNETDAFWREVFDAAVVLTNDADGSANVVDVLVALRVAAASAFDAADALAKGAPANATDAPVAFWAAFAFDGRIGSVLLTKVTLSACADFVCLTRPPEL